MHVFNNDRSCAVLHSLSSRFDRYGRLRKNRGRNQPESQWRRSQRSLQQRRCFQQIHTSRPCEKAADHGRSSDKHRGAYYAHKGTPTVASSRLSAIAFLRELFVLNKRL